MLHSLSIIIPVLNEVHALPQLLDDIHANNVRDHEIIIADSGSTDGTISLIQARMRTDKTVRLIHARKGAATARNAGALHARSPLLFFLDADQRVSTRFIQTAINEFITRKLDIACFYAQPIQNRPWNIFFWWVCNNLLFRPGQYIFPSGSTGSGLIIRRDIHLRINGFDEHIHVIHDHDYVRRASKCGKFRMIKGMKSTFNMRRFDEEGRFKVCMQYLTLTLFHLFHIKATPFSYEFGKHDTRDKK